MSVDIVIYDGPAVFSELLTIDELNALSEEYTYLPPDILPETPDYDQQEGYILARYDNGGSDVYSISFYFGTSFDANLLLGPPAVLAKFGGQKLTEVRFSVLGISLPGSVEIHIKYSGDDAPTMSEFLDLTFDEILDSADTINDVAGPIIGTDGNDFLTGEDGNDDIRLGNGDDTGKGGDGDDTIDGGGGNDVIVGGDGNDVVSGGPGNDMVWAGPLDQGDDVINGGDGDDVLAGGRGDDTLSGERGNDTIYGGDDNDSIEGGDGFDVAWLGNSVDRLAFDQRLSHNPCLQLRRPIPPAITTTRHHGQKLARSSHRETPHNLKKPLNRSSAIMP